MELKGLDVVLGLALRSGRLMLDLAGYYSEEPKERTNPILIWNVFLSSFMFFFPPYVLGSPICLALWKILGIMRGITKD